MRATLSDEVERRRVGGPLNGGCYGAFNLVSPSLGRALMVIVSDGRDWAEEGLPGERWEHVSVSARHGTPSWDEMCWIKGLFWGPDECVVQFHPGADDYVNIHKNCLHLWARPGAAFPMPPKQCV